MSTECLDLHSPQATSKPTNSPFAAPAIDPSVDIYASASRKPATVHNSKIKIYLNTLPLLALTLIINFQRVRQHHIKCHACVHLVLCGTTWSKEYWRKVEKIR
jgi:hypothetical protein